MATPTIRDYVGTLGVNASVLASDIQDLLDHSQNAYVIAKLSVRDVSILEENIVAMMDRIKAIRGDFARMSK
jgi:regulator of protease activity HflC (stomatin/prohibitin superfamily)